MYIVDIPPYDMAAEFVVMAEKQRIQEEMARKLEADKKVLQEATQMLQQQNAEAELANLKCDSFSCSIMHCSCTMLCKGFHNIVRSLMQVEAELGRGLGGQE